MCYLVAKDTERWGCSSAGTLCFSASLCLPCGDLLLHLLDQLSQFFFTFLFGGGVDIPDRALSIDDGGVCDPSLVIRCTVGTPHHLLAHTIRFRLPHRGSPPPDERTSCLELRHANA